MFVRNGEVFDINTLQVIGENQYPVGWFHDADRRAEFGITEVPDPPPIVNLTQLKASLVEDVDNRIAAICHRWLRFEAAYTKREASARAFKAGNYEGDPDVWITAFSNAVGMTPAAAADLIIAQADGLHNALEQIDALRMTKYGIVGAVTAAAAQEAHDTIVSQAQIIVAGL
jgi:hypothetical protein